MLTPEIHTKDKLLVAYSTFDDGNMSYDYGTLGEEAVTQNRSRFFSKFIPASTQFSTSVVSAKHGDTIIVLRRPAKFENALHDCDAIITDHSNNLLFLASADCIPLVAHDPIKNVLALIHAGYKSTDLKITYQTINKMVELFGCQPGDIHLIIGPAIQKDSFKYTNFPLQHKADWQKYIHPIDSTNPSYVKIDNIGYNFDQAIKAGILPEKVSDIKLDTASDERFFSHFRDYHAQRSDQGRFATACMLK